MSNPEAPQPEATPDAIRDEVREQPRETQSPQDPSQRQFLKSLFGGAAGIAGLAVAGELLNPTPAEAAYSVGGANTFPSPTTTGDLVNTNLRVDGHLAVKGYRPWIDVTAYGAVGDWSQWADAAVAAAFAAVPPQGGVVYFPPGVYAFNGGPIAVSDKHITIAGGGRAVTHLYWQGAGGFDLSFSNPGYRVTIRDLSMQANASGVSSAIKITYPWAGGDTCQPHIHDILIGPWNSGHWAKGIELFDGSGAKIERFEIVGAGPGTTHGIHLRSNPLNPNSGGSSIVNIASGFIYNVGTAGIEVSDKSEGTYIRGVEVVGAEVGYKLTSAKPGSAISDCHAMTTQHGIYLKNHGEMALIGNLLYGTGPGGWTGIHVEGGSQGDSGPSARRVRIIGNAITNVPEIINGVPQPPGNRIGIFLVGAAHDCTIQGNVLTEMNFGIVFSSLETPPGSGTFYVGTHNNIVLGNRIQAAANQHLILGGTGNQQGFNLLT